MDEPAALFAIAESELKTYPEAVVPLRGLLVRSMDRQRQAFDASAFLRSILLEHGDDELATVHDAGNVWSKEAAIRNLYQ